VVLLVENVPNDCVNVNVIVHQSGKDKSNLLTSLECILRKFVCAVLKGVETERPTLGEVLFSETDAAAAKEMPREERRAKREEEAVRKVDRNTLAAFVLLAQLYICSAVPFEAGF
jgi:hypothetical protein